MTVERGAYGQWVIHEYVTDGYRVFLHGEQFYDYTKREAIQAFRASLRDQRLEAAHEQRSTGKVKAYKITLDVIVYAETISDVDDDAIAEAVIAIPQVVSVASEGPVEA